MTLSRRRFLGRIGALGLGLAVAGPVLAACGATPTPQIVRETVIVEKPVTGVVKEITRIVAGTPQTVRETVVVEKPVEKQVTKLVEKVVTAAVAKPVKVELWTTEQRSDIPYYPETAKDVTGVQFLANRIYEWQEQNPGVTVRLQYRKPTIEQWHAYIAGKEAPTASIEYLGKIAGISAAGGATPMEGKFDAVKAKYRPGLFDAFTHSGHLWGLPLHAWVIQCIPIAEVWKEAGVAELLPKLDGPRAWKLEAYEQGQREITKKLKKDGVWGGIFCAKGANDYRSLPYLTMFGATLYKGGDHSKTALNSVESAKGLAWIKKMLEDKAFPNPMDFGGDEYFDYISRRLIGVVFEDSGWATRDWVKEYKKTEKPFGQFACQLPTAPGVDKVPLAGGPSGFVFPTGHTADETAWAVKLALRLSEPDVAPVLVGSRTPARDDVQSAYRDNPEFRWVSEYWGRLGVFDLGIGLPKGKELSTAMANLWQQAFTGVKSIEAALKEYEETANALLK